MLKKPWICPACRSIARIRSAPAVLSMSATSLAVIGTRGASFLSCRAYPKYGITAVMRIADERFAASIMISNSMMLRFTGRQVDWIRNTSLPRTFSCS